MSDIQRLAAMLAQSKDTLVLTGAGVSTESGIPDFRSPGTGLWSTMDPMELFSRSVLVRNPRQFWQQAERFFARWPGPSPIAPTMPWQNWKRQV